MSAKKPFKPIDEMLLDEAADRVALAGNIPTLRAPSAATAARPPQAAAVQTGVPQTVPNEQGSRAAPSSKGIDYFRVRCPEYVTEQLETRRMELRRHGQHVTISYLVMKALRTDGYHIAEEDFVEDGRRLR